MTRFESSTGPAQAAPAFIHRTRQWLAAIAIAIAVAMAAAYAQPVKADEVDDLRNEVRPIDPEGFRRLAHDVSK